MSQQNLRDDGDYMAYHRRVVDAVRANLRLRALPQTTEDFERLERNVAFFDLECTYDEDWQENRDPEEVASDNIDAADWSL